MPLVHDIAGFFLPPLWSLRVPADYRGAPLAERVGRKTLLGLIVGQTTAQPYAVCLNPRAFALKKLDPIPAQDGRVGAEALSKLNRTIKASYLAISLALPPEQGAVEAVKGQRRFSSALAFQVALAHSPGMILPKPKVGFSYCGFQHPELSCALAGMVNPDVEQKWQNAARAAGMTLVRCMLSLYQLANVGLADKRVREGASLLILDQLQVLLIQVSPTGGWEVARSRSLKTPTEFTSIVPQLVRATIPDKASRIVCLDTLSSGGIDVAHDLSPYVIHPFVLDGIPAADLPAHALVAA